MLEFTNERTVPPGGRYFYEVPETRVVISLPGKDAFFSALHKHYAENGLSEPEDLEAIAIDFMCQRLPRGFCEGEGEPGPVRINMSDVKRITSSAARGTLRVTPGEARNRALVCGKCPLNDRSGCPTCSGLSAWATRLGGVNVPGGSTYLGICKLDGLAMAAGVALETAPVSSEAAPDTCWRVGA